MLAQGPNLEGKVRNRLLSRIVLRCASEEHVDALLRPLAKHLSGLFDFKVMFIRAKCIMNLAGPLDSFVVLHPITESLNAEQRKYGLPKLVQE